MKDETAFEIDLPGYRVQRMTPEDIPAIQRLAEQCLDFMLLVDGRPADPESMEEDFHDVPPGCQAEDKYIFGIYDARRELVGYLDTVRGYPQKDTWWIGLLLFQPQVRSRGIGQKVLEGFSGYVLAQGIGTLMLGVVEVNERAYKFWQRMGFEFVRKKDPQQYGVKMQTVIVMRKELGAQG